MSFGCLIALPCLSSDQMHRGTQFCHRCGSRFRSTTEYWAIDFPPNVFHAELGRYWLDKLMRENKSQLGIGRAFQQSFSGNKSIAATKSHACSMIRSCKAVGHRKAEPNTNTVAGRCNYRLECSLLSLERLSKWHRSSNRQKTNSKMRRCCKTMTVR